MAKSGPLSLESLLQVYGLDVDYWGKEFKKNGISQYKQIQYLDCEDFKNSIRFPWERRALEKMIASVQETKKQPQDTCQLEKREVMEIGNELVEQIRVWMKDTEFDNAALGHMEKMVKHVRFLCTIENGIQYWSKMLKNEEILSSFLVYIVEKERRYDQEMTLAIASHIETLISLSDNTDFPNKNLVTEWADNLQQNRCKESGDYTKENKKQVEGNVQLPVKTYPAKDASQSKLEAAAAKSSFTEKDTSYVEQTDQRKDCISKVSLKVENKSNTISPETVKYSTKENTDGYVDECSLTQKSGGEEALNQHTIDGDSKEQIKLDEERPGLKNVNQLDTVYMEMENTATFNRNKDSVSNTQHYPEVKATKIPEADKRDANTAETELAYLLDMFGLTSWYPGKISIQHVMVLKKDPLDKRKLTNLPWIILEKLVMANFHARDEDTSNISLVESEKNKFHEVELNPCDIFVTVFLCCDLILKKILSQKMIVCQLAIPFMYPHLPNKQWMLSLWPLHSIVVEWRDSEQKARETCISTELCNIVSFIRYDRPDVSKSKYLNDLLTEQSHHTFCNEDCFSGDVEKTVANGLVEATWFIPEGKDRDFKRITMFLNLRGDVALFEKQKELIRELSDVVVVFVDEEHIAHHSFVELCKHFHLKKCKIILFIQQNERKPFDITRKSLHRFIMETGQNISITYCIETLKKKKGQNVNQMKKKNKDEVLKELRMAIHNSLLDKEGKNLTKVCNSLNLEQIVLDEFEEECQLGLDLSSELTKLIAETPFPECKLKMLPFQGENWYKWSVLMKESHRNAYDTNTINEKERQMKALRDLQAKEIKCLSKVTSHFIIILENNIKIPQRIAFFLQWLKLFLDWKCREALPDLFEKRSLLWSEMKLAQKESIINQCNLDKICDDLRNAEKAIQDASFGIENLFREMGQIFEALIDSQLKFKLAIPLDHLANNMAALILQGHPFELMDGDVSCVPITWIKAVFNSICAIIGEKKRVLVISVLGIQSSGKSTLLNTMFGLQFAVSAGRCTRGVYMQMVQVQPECLLPYDIVLVIDTEGLHSLSLDQSSYAHDNELATLVIGLGDVTIINIKGENTKDIQDILQIAVHAFLRMKLVNKNTLCHQSCVFLHQNVPAVHAKEKMEIECQKMQDNLDKMTVEAATQEGISNITCFKEVINFSGQKNVWYFPDLWLGCPPMAPANPAYSEKINEVKQYILHKLMKNDTCLTISDVMMRIEDLWKGVISDDFVFSFKNSLYTKAYKGLEKKYFELVAKIQREIATWITTKARPSLEHCKPNELERSFSDLKLKLTAECSNLAEKIENELTKFFEGDSLGHVLIEWKDKKIESIKMQITVCETNAVKTLIEMKESHRIHYLQITDEEKNKEVILRRVAQTAADLKEMDGTKPDEAIIKSTFETMWTERLHEINLIELDKRVPIEQRVREVLWTILHDKQHILYEKLGSNALPMSSIKKLRSSFDIALEYLSIRPTWREKLKNLVGMTDLEEKCILRAYEVTSNILYEIDHYLRSLPEYLDFNEAYATQLLEIVEKRVSEHNALHEKMTPFTFTGTYTVDLAIHICVYAVKIFNDLQQKYDKKYSPAAKLESWKSTALQTFESLVYQRKTDFIVADLLFPTIKNLLIEAVERSIGLEVEYLLNSHMNQKEGLLKELLTDLANDDSLSRYSQYLKNPKGFALNWLNLYAIHLVFEEYIDGFKNRYLKFAAQDSENIFHNMKKCIEWHESQRPKTEEFALENQLWAQELCNVMPLELLLTETRIKSAANFTKVNITNLLETLLASLPKMRKEVDDYFQNKSANKWDCRSHCQRKLEQIWGCDAKCPFCEEECRWTECYHLGAHCCMQHRPQGLSGTRWESTQKLVVENCEYLAFQENQDFYCETCRFQCRDVCKAKESKTRHAYRKYKEFLPKWVINPNQEIKCSPYWKWVMNKFKTELADQYMAKEPDIPSMWKTISKEEAIKSLSDI